MLPRSRKDGANASYTPTMPTPTQFDLTLDGTPVRVTRRRKQGVVIRAYPDGRVTLSVPTWFTKAKAREFVVEHRAQILAQAARVAPSPTERAYRLALARLAELDRVPVWGRETTVLYRDVAARASAKLERGGLVLSLPEDAQGEDPEACATRRLALERLLAREMEARIPELSACCMAALGITAEHWSVRKMTSRWGSCRWETKRITLNLDLATHDPRYLQSVALHEACHLIAHDHGPAFKALMDRVSPNWRALDLALRQEGVRLRPHRALPEAMR